MLSALKFDTLASLMGAKEPVKSAVREVLVEGHKAAEAARHHSVSPQSVSNSLKRYRKALAAIEAAFGDNNQNP